MKLLIAVGLVKRRHGHIVDLGLALMNQLKLPLKFWIHAFSVATFLHNKTPVVGLSGQSPYQLLFKEAPKASSILMVGLFEYETGSTKQIFFSIGTHIFIRYPKEFRGHMRYNPKKKKIFMSSVM